MNVTAPGGLDFWPSFGIILALTGVTFATRCFFLVTDREIPLPDWLRRGLRHAPLAAVVAVAVPEILMTHGHLITTWQDARPYAAIAGTAYFFWRRSILGTIVTGMAVLVPLKLVFGW